MKTPQAPPTSRRRGRKYKFIYRGKWQEIYEDRLVELSKGNEDERASEKFFRQLIHNFESEPLKYFLPHGDYEASRKKYPNEIPEADGGMLDFMNDNHSDLTFMLAPNQTGKTFSATAKTIMRAIPTDPEWPVFKEHGLAWQPWKGPQRVVVASYSWVNVAVLWETYRLLLPREELGQYSPDWGNRRGEDGKPKNLTFGDGKPKLLDTACGTQFLFQCYTQPQHAWEGYQSDLLHADEQIPKDKFIGWVRSTTTRGDDCQAIVSLTGHVVTGRPDTGAAGWMHRELWRGEATMGMSMGRYCTGAIEFMPDAIISEKQKDRLYKRWVEEPRRVNDRLMYEEGLARYFGGWQPGGGLVYSNFRENRNVVPPFKIPADWTRYRGLDFGRTRPFAAVLLAVSPRGDLIAYNEYYRAGLTPAANAKGVLRVCGNERRQFDVVVDEDSGANYPIYEEIYKGEYYFSSVLDSRSFGTKSERQCTVGQLLNEQGLTCSPASGSKDEDAKIGRIRDLLDPHPGREHLMDYLLRLELVTEEDYEMWQSRYDGDEDGAPVLYVTGTCVNGIREFHSWANKENGKPEDKNNHWLDALKYLISDDPRYFGGSFIRGAGVESPNYTDDQVESAGYSTIMGYSR